MTCRLLLADDHALIRVGVRAMVDTMPGYEVVGEAEDGRQAVLMAQRLRPDIILLDVTMHGLSGLEALQELAVAVPNTRVLMLSMHAEADVVFAALEKGARGYLLKDAAIDELHQALNAVVRGQCYLSSAIAEPVIEQALARSQPAQPSATQSLTERQIEILRLVSRGVTTRLIAEGLGLSVKTVEAHRAQIMKRLNIHDVAGLVMYAVREGIVDLND